MKFKVSPQGVLLEVIDIVSCVDIPEEINDIPITKIGNGCFKSNNEIESVFIPKTVTSIFKNAFKDCHSLRKVVFKDGSTLKTIKERAFENCTSMESIDFPASLKYIEDRAFSQAGLKSINFPVDSALKDIGSFAFTACNIKSVSFPKNTRAINAGAFQNNANLKYATFPYPSKINNIGMAAFLNCNLQEVILYTRKGCYIGRGAFSNNDIKTLDMTNAQVKVIPPLFANENKISELHLPDSIKLIDYAAFKYNEINELTLPNEVTELKTECFSMNPISKIDFNYAGITEIGPMAFDSTTSVSIANSSAYMYGISDKAFGSSKNNEINEMCLFT